MLESLIRPFRNLDKRVRIAIVSNGLVTFGTQLSARYDTIYATDLGVNPLDLGLLSSIGSFFAAIFAVPLGWAAERYSVKKVILFGLTSFIAHIVLFALAGNWFMLVGAYILSTKLLRTSPLSDIIFVTAS